MFVIRRWDGIYITHDGYHTTRIENARKFKTRAAALSYCRANPNYVGMLAPPTIQKV